MEFDQLTDEQISRLTPEQIEIVENDPSKLAGFVGEQEATEQPEQEEQDAANGKGEEEAPTVLTKNGKGIIPYEKHKELRVENSTLRQQLQDAQAKLDELSQKKDEAVGKKDIEAADEALAEHLENLKQEMPELHVVVNAILEGSRKQGEKLEKTLEQLKREKDESDRVKELSVKEQVAEAKDNNLDLSHWEATDPEAWDEALRQDEILRTTGKWADKSYAERFEEVARRVRAIMPEASVPKKKPEPEEIKTKAKAKVESAPVRKPTTLSDIQSGADVSSEQDQLRDMHPLDLARKLHSMPYHKQVASRADLD